ncbi:MAG: superoxide dismutase [Alistipes sp.]|nr:superoxide dismutase [Alistipes sp.]
MATTMSKIELKPLPYGYKDLEPYISEQTLIYHHDKHLAAYVNKTLELIADTAYADATLEQIMLSADGALFNNAAQVWNHNFYFEQFAPKPQTKPEGRLAEAIDSAFGSYRKLRERMTAEALSLFGSGWVWLASDAHGKLKIVSKPNAGNPLTDGLYPLLAIDVWEHAYYIDHRNARVEGVNALWHIIDWRIVDARYDAILNEQHHDSLK